MPQLGPIDTLNSTKAPHEDTPWENLNSKLHFRYIIGHILECGDIDNLKWLFNEYLENKIKETIKTSNDEVLKDSPSILYLYKNF